jgi:hypothetical protein
VRGWPDPVKEEMGGQLNKVEYIDIAKKRYSELVERRKRQKL